MADKEPPYRSVNRKDKRSQAAKDRDLIERGDNTPTPGGRAVFFLLRSLEPFWQYSILAHGVGSSLLHRVGLRTLPPPIPAHTGIPLIDGLHLSPYRLILMGMVVGGAVKQNIWLTCLSAEPMTVKNACIISSLYYITNSIMNYAFLCNVSSESTAGSFPQPTLMIGGALYVTGILTELIAEIQRYRFKKNPANKGKAYTGGLWKLARHINYGAYTLWRTGYAMAASGWILGGLVGAFHFFDFATRAVPVLNEYCEPRYGAQWEAFKKQTPYRLLPFIY